MIQHRIEIIKALFVTILWSSSWVIIKQGLEDIPPLIFASLRYLLASIVLIIVVIIGDTKISEIKILSKKEFGLLFLYGIIFISLTQGLQFIALDILPAITISFVLNFSIFIVIIMSFFILGEVPNKLQLVLLLIAATGGLLYFYPLTGFEITLFGVSILLGVLLSNSSAQILGRHINVNIQLDAIVITSISMLGGSLILFAYALIVEELPNFSLKLVLIISWLAIVNTAFAFTMWNHTMEYLKAYESSIINNTMLPQIAFLAYLFLDERPSMWQWVSLIIIMVSAILVTLVKPSEDSKELNIEKST